MDDFPAYSHGFHHPKSERQPKDSSFDALLIVNRFFLAGIFLRGMACRMDGVLIHTGDWNFGRKRKKSQVVPYKRSRSAAFLNALVKIRTPLKSKKGHATIRMQKIKEESYEPRPAFQTRTYSENQTT